MKVDKQALAKHHFWILLGVFGLFALLLIILVPILVGAEIEDKEKKIKETESKLKSNSNPTTDAYTKAQQEEIDQLSGRRQSLWSEMYGLQRDIVAFPGELHEPLKDSKFGDEIDRRYRDKYRRDIYGPAYEELADLIQPTEFVPNWEAVLQPAIWSTKSLLTSEEMWLSLEDLCVRREVLKIIQAANQETAAFTPREPGPKDAKLPQSNLGEGFSRRFVNRWYQIDLVINDKGRGNYTFGGKIKNIDDRRHKIYELALDVWLTHDLGPNDPSRPETVRYSMDALAAGEERQLPEVTVELNRRPENIFRMALHHNLQTVPVKYLLEIAFGLDAAGHRMADKQLVMAKFSKPADTAATGGDKPTGMSPMPGGMSKPPMGGMGTMGYGQGSRSSSAGEVTENGIVKPRYIDLTDQVRRIPLAVVMVIDQNNLPDVLCAFSNSSRMRFQVTQYHWKRVYLNSAAGLQYSSGSGAGAGGPSAGTGGSRPMGGTGPSAGFGPMGGMGARPGGSAPIGRFGPMGGGGMRPMGGDPSAGGGAASGIGGKFGGGGMAGSGSGSSSNVPTFTDQPPTNLIEITVYGIANIYEKPKESTAPASTTGVTAPVSPAPVSPMPPAPAANQRPMGGDKSVKPMDPKATPMGSAPKGPDVAIPAGKPSKTGDAKTAPMGGQPKGPNSGAAAGKPSKPGDSPPKKP